MKIPVKVYEELVTPDDIIDTNELYLKAIYNHLETDRNLREILDVKWENGRCYIITMA